MFPGGMEIHHGDMNLTDPFFREAQRLRFAREDTENPVTIRKRYLSVRLVHGRKSRWLAFFGWKGDEACVATTNAPSRLA